MPKRRMVQQRGVSPQLRREWCRLTREPWHVNGRNPFTGRRNSMQVPDREAPVRAQLVRESFRRNRIGGMGLLPMPSFHTTVRTDPYTAVPSNKLNS